MAAPIQTDPTLVAVGIVLALIFLFIVFVLGNVTIVQTEKCIVLERFGVFSRIAKEGIHILVFEKPKTVRWTYRVESMNPAKEPLIKTTNLSQIPLNNSQLDCVPFTGKTSDGVVVLLNGTLHYKITNPKDAVYETDQLLSFLEDCVAQATRVVCFKHRYDQLLGMDYELATEMIQTINDQSKSYGVECVKFMLQSIRTSPEIEAASQKQIAAQKESETKHRLMQQEHELTMKQLEMDRMREESTAELVLQSAMSRAKLELLNTQSEAERANIQNEVKAGEYAKLIAAGIPGDKIPALMFSLNAKNITKLMVMGGGSGVGGTVMLPQLD